MTNPHPDKPSNTRGDTANIGAAPPPDFARAFCSQHVLVTGGGGFIGSHLVERLVAAQAHVVVLDQLPAAQLSNLRAVRADIRYIQADLLHCDLAQVLTGDRIDTVFHLAGNANVGASVQSPWHDFQTNLVATLRLLETLRSLDHPIPLIFTSSAAVYGDTSATTVTEENYLAPISPYGVSKLAADRYLQVYADLYHLPLATLRPFSVYGPRLRKQVVYDLIVRINASTGEIEARGDGSQVRDFCYVTDLVDAALCVASLGRLQGEVYNVAIDQACSIRELVATIASELGKNIRVNWSGAVQPGEPQRWYPHTGRLQALGWLPQVRLPEGIHRTVAWFLQDPDRVSIDGNRLH
ncbi:MAG: GDP-mannose 4,6-dehydratase [Pirellulaceae bacterium]|nr:GDP-mannose 4,6-dehydratase [Planctomycetales bacterium]